MPIVTRRLTPVPFTHVHFTDAFWAPRQEVNRRVTLPHIYQKLDETGRISAFDLNFVRPAPYLIVDIFADSDLAKWVEAASYSLATHPDPALAALVDGVADKIISAQQPDGYLNTHFMVTQPDMRWKNLRDWHELYCAGHLMEAAVAHSEATGQRKLLDALSRYADHIDATFGPGPGQRRGYCGHPEIELALIRLYHATGHRRYLALARYFVDERGQAPHYYDLEARERGEDPRKFWHKTYEYNQAHRPIREQEKVVGHAVRAMYLFSAATDLAHETDEATLLETSERLWQNLISKRMYLTGGIGPSYHNEGFTDDYDLPDETAYAETCATIGLALWNHRLLQFEGDRRFADVMERGLYNGFLSGVSLEGAHFLYENPLSSAGQRRRAEWFACPCCPPNVARLLASIGNYFYSTGPSDLWVHLFAASTAQVEIGDQSVTITQSTRYPWDGAVTFHIDPARPAAFTLRVRVPGWCEHYRLALNGEALELTPDGNGYLALDREWQPGDTLAYTMAMPIRPTWAHPAVRQLQGRVALQRGPVVYCLEGADHGDILLDRISVNPERLASEFTVEERPDWLGGTVVIHGQGQAIAPQGDEALYPTAPPANKTIALAAVPYCVWGNRAPGEMRVWLRTNEV